jgi:hypothetical protein
MKAPKNRIKAFRVDCVNCHSTQDALRFACSACQQRLYTNMEEAELQAVGAQVAAMEQALAQVEAPQPAKGSPYAPIDSAWAAYKALRGYTYIPGMVHYLDRVLEVLLPIKVRLLERTLKANWVFLVVLVAFPLVTLVFRMHWTMPIMLLLPAIVWLLVTLKARSELVRTRKRLAQILPA